MASHCFVAGADYARHWPHDHKEKTIVAAPYAGPERRLGTADRRAPRHDRHAETSRGRRFRFSDRRRTK